MLQPGTTLPPLNLTDHTGATVTTSHLIGRWTVLWWYVKADTPG